VKRCALRLQQHLRKTSGPGRVAIDRENILRRTCHPSSGVGQKVVLGRLRNQASQLGCWMRRSNVTRAAIASSGVFSGAI